jgi:hypothetical protein
MLRFRRLRETLGDNADNPTFIETIPRRGYRFIAPLAEEQESPPIPVIPANAPAISRRKFLAFAGVSIVTIAAFLLWWASRTTHTASTIVRSKQLTFSGQVGNPYFAEALQSIQTDGQRIYYTDKLSRLRFIATNGGEEGYVQTNASNVVLLHISPDGSTLLVRDFFSSEGSSESPLWLMSANGVPASASARSRLRTQHDRPMARRSPLLKDPICSDGRSWSPSPKARHDTWPAILAALVA